jgi:hypothetical protein
LTPVPLDVEAGACYMAVAAITHGHARGIGIRALVGSRDSSDERGVNDESGAVAFCANDREHARIDIDARGTAIAWAMAVYRIESGVWSPR